MAYTTTQLITRAWYLSGVVARDEETVTGEQLTDGLNMLNALLSFKTANQRLIPYYQDYEFNGVIGQQKYFIPNLVLTETLTFVLNTVRYSMMLVQRREYFATPRANEINSLPYEYFVERTLGGSNLYMYFSPQDTYLFHLHGKFSLNDVTLGQDLSLTLDAFYIEYLRYALAEYMCQEYNITFQIQSEKKLTEFERVLIDISPIDFTLSKLSVLQRKQSPDIYGQANIGRGYIPG
jgi:hypothetical protein